MNLSTLLVEGILIFVICLASYGILTSQFIGIELRMSCRRLNSKSAVVHRRIQKLIQCSMRFINNGKIYRIYDSGLIQAADLLNSLKSFSQSQQVTRQTESIVELLKKQTLT